MPLNEARGFYATHLTAKERREAIASLYGAPMTDPNETMTVEDRVRFRRYLDTLDQQDAGRKEFDLNKPPAPPYRYQEFPFLMYRHGALTTETRSARTAEERERMRADGWTADPRPPEPDPAPFSQEYPVLMYDAKGNACLARTAEDRRWLAAEGWAESESAAAEAAADPFSAAKKRRQK